MTMLKGTSFYRNCSTVSITINCPDEDLAITGILVLAWWLSLEMPLYINCKYLVKVREVHFH